MGERHGHLRSMTEVARQTYRVAQAATVQLPYIAIAVALALLAIALAAIKLKTTSSAPAADAILSNTEGGKAHLSS